MSHLLKSRSRNSAFTLIELLVVIAIIGILASLAAVGAMKVLERSKMVTARIEIGQLEAAVSAAKLDLGNVDELPSVIIVYQDMGKFSGKTSITTESAFNKKLRESTFTTMQKVFGRNFGKNATTNDYFYPISTTNSNPDITNPVKINWLCQDGKVIQGMQAYIFWLGGMYTNTGGKYSFTGFSTDKRDPCELASLKRKGPYFDFDSSRVKNIGMMPGSTYLTYVNGWDGEYTYFSNSSYKLYADSFSTTTADPDYAKKYSSELNNYSVKVKPYKNGNVFFNAKSFQIIGSGQNQMFGPGGSGWTPGSGLYAIDADGYDDLSNFSSTQLGKKDE